MDKPYPYSKSAIGVFQLCKRKYKYQYLDKMEGCGDKQWQLRFGSTWHKALEVGYWPNLHLTYDDHVQACIDAAAAYDDECGGLLMSVMLACYIDRWSESDYECLETEGEYVVEHTAGQPGSNQAGNRGCGDTQNMGEQPNRPFRYILDGRVLEKGTGRVLRVEHKTTKRPIEPTADYWDLQFDLQLGMYEALDTNASGTIYCVTKVPPLKPGKIGRRVIVESDEEFIARASEFIQKDYDKWFVRRLVETNGGVMNDAHGEAAGIEFYKSYGYWPRNKNACGSWSRTCEYKPVCNGEEEITSELYQIRKRR